MVLVAQRAVRSQDSSGRPWARGLLLASKATQGKALEGMAAGGVTAMGVTASHPLLHLQRVIGNKAVEQVLRGGSGRPAISAPGDRTEREARRVADAVMRADARVRFGGGGASRTVSDGGGTVAEAVGGGAAGAAGADSRAVDGAVVGVAIGGSASGAPRRTVGGGGGEFGKPLDHATREVMEARFGVDFGTVRIHTSASAHAAAETLHARAFTVGEHIGFGAGEYRPNTVAGRRLLAHELAHVVQQRTGATPMIQRDLKAYNRPRTEVIPTGGYSGSTTYVNVSAEAPGLRAALQHLIAAGRIRVVDAPDGSASWFGVEDHHNVQLGEIQAALAAAGYRDPDRLAAAIFDKHRVHLFSEQTMTTTGLFFSRTVDLGQRIENQTNRVMTQWEIREARRVFGDAIDYSVVTVSEGSLEAHIGTIGGYARVVGNTMYFPPGTSSNMALMIHELTHVWQYQTIGWQYAPLAILVHASPWSEGYNYSEPGKTPAQSLIDARARGKRLQDYNMEQQGDIVRDYYIRLRNGDDTSAWDPFIADIRGN